MFKNLYWTEWRENQSTGKYVVGSAHTVPAHTAALQQCAAKAVIPWKLEESLGSVGSIPRCGFGDLCDNFESKFKVTYPSSNLSWTLTAHVYCCEVAASVFMGKMKNTDLLCCLWKASDSSYWRQQRLYFWLCLNGIYCKEPKIVDDDCWQGKQIFIAQWQ